MVDHIARIADAIERIASHLEQQSAQSRQHIEKDERFERSRKRLLQLLDRDKRFGGLVDRAMSCPELGMDIIIALAERPDPLVVLNEIVTKSSVARRLAWMDEPGLAAEMQCIEQRLSLIAVAR
jgi:hypothetical protein